jgi:hypothetical protein
MQFCRIWSVRLVLTAGRQIADGVPSSVCVHASYTDRIAYVAPFIGVSARPALLLAVELLCQQKEMPVKARSLLGVVAHICPIV